MAMALATALLARPAGAQSTTGGVAPQTGPTFPGPVLPGPAFSGEAEIAQAPNLADGSADLASNPGRFDPAASPVLPPSSAAPPTVRPADSSTR